MKRIIASVTAAAVALMLSAAVLADTGDTAADSVETVSEETVDENAGKEISAEKRLGGVLLVSSVCGAMVIAALIWRGRDRTKYL